jgi:hypothetical protein
MDLNELTTLVPEELFGEWVRIQKEGAINMLEAGTKYPDWFPPEVFYAILENYKTLEAHYAGSGVPAKRPKVMSQGQLSMEHVKGILSKTVGAEEAPPSVPHDMVRELMTMRQSDLRFEVCAVDQSLFSSIEALLQQNPCEVIFDEDVGSKLFPDEWKAAKAMQAADPDNYVEVAWQVDSTPEGTVRLDEKAALLICWLLGNTGASFDHDSVRSIEWQQSWEPFDQQAFENKCIAGLKEMSNAFTGYRKKLPGVPTNVTKLYIYLHTKADEPNSFNIDSNIEELRMMMAQDALGAYIDEKILSALYPDSVDTERDNFYFGGQLYRPGEDLDSIAEFPMTGSAAVVTCWLAKCLTKDKREEMLRDIPWLVSRLDDETLVQIATNLIAGRQQHFPYLGNRDAIATTYLDPTLEWGRSNNVRTASAKNDPGAVANVLKRSDVQAAVRELYGYDDVQFKGGQDADVIVTVNKDTAIFVIVVAMHASVAQVQTWQTCS